MSKLNLSLNMNGLGCEGWQCWIIVHLNFATSSQPLWAQGLNNYTPSPLFLITTYKYSNQKSDQWVFHSCFFVFILWNGGPTIEVVVKYDFVFFIVKNNECHCFSGWKRLNVIDLVVYKLFIQKRGQNPQKLTEVPQKFGGGNSHDVI